jgi:aldehyde:ferredoxin oxidoreductase
MTARSAKIAHIDLTHRQIDFEYFPLSSIRKWGGGSGLASWRLYRNVGHKTQPLDPENEVWIIGGPLTGTRAPCSGRVEVVTKSALTGLIGLTNAGGYFGARLKQTGLDGLVLHGASSTPVYILIAKEKIEIRDALPLWGKDTWETEELIGTELQDPNLKRIKVMAIGPAGENLVRFACLINERYHAAARGGAGAVLGSKKVKAVVVDAQAPPLAANSTFRKAADQATKKILDSPSCQKYSRCGALPVSDAASELGSLPGKNFQTGILPRWKETRGTETIMSFVTRHEASCYRCPMPCFNRVEVPEGQHKGLTIASGTFVVPILEFGAKCGIESPAAIWKCKELCHRQGLDFCSTAGTIAFAMELFQRGLLASEQREDLNLAWGNEQAVMKLIMQIALRSGLGNILGEGSLMASRILGPATSPYVMTIKGMEMISQDVRVNSRGVAFGSLTSSRGGDNVRGTHMKGESIPSPSLLKPENFHEWLSFSDTFVSQLDMFPAEKDAIYGVPPLVDPTTYQGKARMAKWFEDLFAAVNALGLCIFPADKLALGPTDYADLLSAFLEEDITPEEFMEIGERIFNIQRLYSIREGITRRDDTWPERFFEEKLPEGPSQGAIVSRETISRVLDEYYDNRGWSRTTGHPTPETLSRLGIEEQLDF